jgi:putative ABC transport system permease protein
MRRFSLKSLAYRRGRSILTALAIVLGVSMISGTYVLTDTIDRAFNGIFNASYQDTNVVISGKPVVKGAASGAPTIPASLLQRVRSLPDVDAAAGSLMDLSSESNSVKLLDHSGKAITGGSPTLGFGIDTSQPRFNPLKLVEGRWAAGAGDVVIDAGTAKKHDFHVGERVSVSARGPIRQFTIAGIARYGKVDSLGGATIAVFTVPTAQRLLGKPGQFDQISLAAKPGVSDAQLARGVRPLLPPTARVQTGDERAQADAKDTKTFVKYIRYFLLAFAALALFVGAFVIFNTLSITVAQRAREFATLRTLGASRRQVLRSVLLEGAVLGTLASLVGLGLGVVLAKGLTAVMKLLQLELPSATSVVATRTVVVSLGVGIVMTLAATIVPALRATRVPPIAAVREGAVLPGTRLAHHRSRLAVGVLSLAAVLLSLGSFAGGLGTGQKLALLGVGLLALFSGVALVASRLVGPLTSAVGQPAQRLGGEAGRLAKRNALRDPARTASTAAALMIGLAMVTVVATLGDGLRRSDTRALEHQVRADYVITAANGFGQLSGETLKAVPARSAAGVISPVLDDRAHVLGGDVQVEGLDPATIGDAYRFDWREGSSDAVLSQLGSDGAIVKASYADKHHLHIGSQLALTSPSGRHVPLRVAGIFAPPSFDKVSPVLGPISIPRSTFETAFPRPKVRMAFVTVPSAVPAETAQAALAAGLKRFPDANVQTRDEWVTEQANGINKLLNLLYVLLALSVIVSLFGMVNTLVLAVSERTRELGMLRAVGMTRRQLRRMIRHESIITALIGAGLGLPLGLAVAGVATHALSGQGVAFSVPLGSLLAFVVVAAVAGIVAAALPARRAARLDVLDALHYE